MISIIIPVYKAEKTLSKCLNSVVEQTYTNFELILVDDGSPDTSGAICDQWAMQDERIRVIHQENKGVSAARNRGLDEARGEYIVFVDSDDRVGKDYLLNLYSALCLDQGIGLIVMGASVYNEDEQLQNELVLPNVFLAKKDFGRAFGDYSLQRFGYPWAKLYLLDAIRKNNLRFDVRICCLEDLYFMYQYLLICDYLVLGDKSDYIYVKHLNSLSTVIHPYTSVYAGFRLYCSLLQQMMQCWLFDLENMDGIYSSLMMGFEWSLKTDYQPGRNVSRKLRIIHLRELIDDNYDVMCKYYHPVFKLDKIGKLLLQVHCYGLYDFFIISLFKLHIGPVLYGPSRMKLGCR